MNIHRVKLILLLSSERSAGAERRKHHTQVRKRPRPARCHSPSQPSLPHAEHTGGMAAPPLPAAPSPAGFCPWHFSSLKNHEESVGNQQKERRGGKTGVKTAAVFAARLVGRGLQQKLSPAGHSPTLPLSSAPLAGDGEQSSSGMSESNQYKRRP